MAAASNNRVLPLCFAWAVPLCERPLCIITRGAVQYRRPPVSLALPIHHDPQPHPHAHAVPASNPNLHTPPDASPSNPHPNALPCQVLLSLGLAGGSLCAAFVVALAAAWGVCEARSSFRPDSLDLPLHEVPLF